MKIPLFAGALCLVSLVSPVLAEEIAVEMKNMGFETEDISEAGMPMDWRARFSNVQEGKGVETTGVIKRDTTMAHEGNASAFLQSDGPRYAYLDQVVELIPGAKYRLSVWYRPSEAAAGKLSVCISGRLQQEKKRWAFAEVGKAPAGQWTQLNVEFVAPLDGRDTARVELRALSTKGAISGWFDDVKLVRLSE